MSEEKSAAYWLQRACELEDKGDKLASSAFKKAVLEDDREYAALEGSHQPPSLFRKG